MAPGKRLTACHSEGEGTLLILLSVSESITIIPKNALSSGSQTLFKEASIMFGMYQISILLLFPPVLAYRFLGVEVCSANTIQTFC